MNPSRIVRNIALAGLIAVYAAIRLWQLTESCLWFDEVFSVHAAEHGWGSILRFVSLDLIHPPLFYLLLKLWIAAGGDSIAWLRLFPVLISILAVFPFIGFCRELKLSFSTQILALFFLAVNGSLIKYAQEVRMYSLLMCLSLFSIWLFTRYFIKGKSFVPLVIVNVLMVYTHYFGWFVVVAEVGLILWFQRIKWRRIVSMSAITLAAFIPWLIAVIAAARSGAEIGQNIGWMARPGIRQTVTFVLNIVEPFYYQASTAEPVSILRISLPILLIITVAMVIYSVYWAKLLENERRNALLLLAFIKLPVLVAFAASWLLPYSMWGTRHLIIVLAPFGILTAVVISSVASRAVKTAAITLLLLLTGYGFFLRSERTIPEYSWCAWEPLINIATARSNDIPVYVVEDLAGYHAWFAVRKKEGSQVVKLTGIEGITEDKAYFLPRGFDGVGTKDLADISDNTLWLAFRSPKISEAEPPLRNLMVKGYRIVDRKEITSGSETAAIILLEK